MDDVVIFHLRRSDANSALWTLKLKPILQFFQQLIDLLRRILRRSFLAVTQLDLDPELQRYVELRLQLKEVRDYICKILDLRWFKLGVGNEALGWCCGTDTAYARSTRRPRSPLQLDRLRCRVVAGPVARRAVQFGKAGIDRCRDHVLDRLPGPGLAELLRERGGDGQCRGLPFRPGVGKGLRKYLGG